MSSISLAELAEKLGAQLYGDGNITINGVAGIETAQTGEITFLSSLKYRNLLIDCDASAVIIKESERDCCAHINTLVMPNPYVGFALAAQFFDITPPHAHDISESAYISPLATIGNNVSIGHNAVIEEGVVLGNNVQIGAGCVIGKFVTIGENTRLAANATIYHRVKIGRDCLIHSNSVIGSDGFGYANDSGTWIKIPQVGTVVIGDCVEIGSCTTIDRGTLENTVIADGVIIDNQCQIAHNVRIGENTAVAGGVIMAGSLNIGKNCMIGGASVINGHMDITDGVTITGMAMVMRPISKPGVYSSGIPAQTNRDWRKTAARLLNIEDIYNRLKSLEKKVNKP